MTVRQLGKNDRFDAFLISSYCFHNRIDNVENERERVENSTNDDWGAFTDEGVMTTRVINIDYDFFVDGTAVKSGGIGGVSTLPEYRRSGGVSEIFKSLLPSAYNNGQVISLLYPFNHAFYRKQGYEVITHKNEYEFEPALLECYKTDCDVKMWHTGDPVTEYLRIYNSFAVNYNLAMPRDEKSMLSHIEYKGVYKDRKFTYLFTMNGISKSYLIFTDIHHDPHAILRVDEAAWTDREGFEAILSFLGRFDADYGTIQLPMPYGIDLHRIIRTRRAYDIKKTTRFDLMIRVINTEKLLKVIKKPQDCEFTIKITDDIISQNNGTWRVSDDNVMRLEDSDILPDIELSERSFAQMAIGGINIDEAVLKPDVKINSNEEMLRKVFIDKHIFINEFF